MERRHFNYDCNSKGYSITYKGIMILNVVAILEKPLRGRAAANQTGKYIKMAEKDICDLMRGIGSKKAIEKIEEIDKIMNKKFVAVVLYKNDVKDVIFINADNTAEALVKLADYYTSKDVPINAEDWFWCIKEESELISVM